MDLAKMKAAEVRHKASKRNVTTPELERQREIRAKMPVKIRHLARGEFELVGATEDDVMNNPKLMRRFDNEVTKYRCSKQDNELVGFAP